MQISKCFFRSSASAVLLLVPLATNADEPGEFHPGVYLGGSWGAYRINESNLDDNDDLLKGFIGAQFTNWFGLEGQWTDFNRLDSGNSSFEADGGGLAAVFSLPTGGTSALFIKLGQFWWDSDSVLGGVVGDQDGDDPFGGVGFKLGFNRHVGLRLEYERFDIANIKLDTASVGVQFNF